MLSKLEDPVLKYSIFAIPATILLILPGNSDPINLPKLLVLFPCAFTATILLITLRRRYPKKVFTGEAALYLSIYVLLGFGVILSGFLGGENYVRILFGASGRNNGILYYLCVIALSMIVLRLLIDEEKVLYLNSIFSWTSLAFGVYSLLQLLDLDPISWSNPYSKVIGTLGNPNFAASALACFAVFWIYQAFNAKKFDFQVGTIRLAIGLVMLFLSWSTDSIQGIIIFVVGISLIGFIHLREKIASSVFPKIFFVASGLFLLVLFSAFLGFGPLGAHLEQYTLKLRAWYAYFGIRGMIDKPWTGYGADNYIGIFRRFRSEEFVAQYGYGLTVNNAHSTPIQIGASFGVLVFALYVILQLLILLRAIQIVSSRNKELAYLKIVAIIWLLVFAQSLLSIEIIGLGVLNWIYGAIILSSKFGVVWKNQNGIIRSKHRKSEKSLPAWTGAVSLLALVLSSIPSVIVTREDRAYQAVAFVQVNDLNGKAFVAQKFNQLSSLTLSYPEKIDNMAKNLWEVGLNQQFKSAIERLYALDSNDVYAGVLLATYYSNVGDYFSESELREKLRLLDPFNGNLELGLARSYANQKKLNELATSVERLRTLGSSSPQFQEAESLLKQLQIELKP